MSYSVYTTPALVLSTRNMGEANRMYTLLTRDVGTINATAQSVRLEKSKLRYSLQLLSFSEVSLVRGRGGWRVTNAYAQSNLFFEFKESKKQDLAIKISRLLRRLLAGESPDPDLFRVVTDGFEVLYVLREEEVADFELVFVMKILASLGYGTGLKELHNFEDHHVGDAELREFAGKNKRLLVKEINTALRASGL